MPQVWFDPGQLGSHQIEYAFRIDADFRISAADSKQRAGGLCPDVCQRILRRHQQSIGDDLRPANRQHPGKTPSHDSRSRRIEERIEERTAMRVSDEL